MDLDASMKKIDAHISRAAPLLDRLESFLSGGASPVNMVASIDSGGLVEPLEEFKTLVGKVSAFRDDIVAAMPEIRKTVGDVKTVVEDLAALRETVAPVIAAFEASQGKGDEATKTEATSDQTAPKG